MVDLFGKDRGNISLPLRLQSLDIHSNNQAYGDHNQNVIINMQKAFYDIKISHLKAVIENLETRNEEISKANSAIEILIQERDLDTSNKIAQLNKEYFVQVDKVQSLRMSIQKVKSLRTQQKNEHLTNVENLNKRYKITRESFISDMKKIDAKINQLKEFNAVKTNLIEKWELGNKSLIDEEEKFNRMLISMKCKTNILKDKIIAEMYEKLLSIAATFQVYKIHKLPSSIHRLIRENTAVKHELTLLLEEILHKKNFIEKEKIYENEYLEKENTYHSRVRKYINKTIMKRCWLERLKEQHMEMNNRLVSIKKSQKNLQINMKDLNKLQETFNIYDYHVRYLKIVLHQEQNNLSILDDTKKKCENHYLRLISAYYYFKNIVLCALQECNNENESILKMKYQNLVIYLLDILTRNSSPRLNRNASSVIHQISELRI